MSTCIENVVYGKSYIQSLPLYVPGRAASAVAREYGYTESSVLKLASNENPLGMSPSARQALVTAAQDASACYPDSEATRLKTLLGKRFGVPSATITIGSGSSEILEMAAKAFAGRGDSVVMSEYSFALYSLAAIGVGATPIVTASRHFGHDLDAMLRAIDATTKLVYVANPNNPTGTLIDQAEIRAFLDRVPEDVVVVLDEAYAEYLPEAEQSSPARLIERYPNLIVARTFSKAYGLAALRIGYCISQPQLASLLNRVRPTFNTSTFAQAAAEGAIEDTDFLEQSRELNARGRQQLYEGFDRLGLPYVLSEGNFVLVEVGDGAWVSQRLLERAIVVRPVANYGLPGWIRITVGLPEQNERLLRALGEVSAFEEIADTLRSA